MGGETVKLIFAKFQTNPGAIIVWGDDSAHQIRDTPPGNKFARIASGGADQSLAIREDGKLTLWSTFPPDTKGTVVLTDVPAPRKAIDAVLSLTHGLAVLDDGTLHTFGHFTGSSKPLPTRPDGLIANIDLATAGHCVAAGGDFCIVIDENKELCQWEAGSTKTPVPPGKFKKVAAKNNYTIALSEEGDLYGWGPPFDAMWTSDAMSTSITDKYLAGWATGTQELLGKPPLVYYYLKSVTVPAQNVPIHRSLGHEYVDIAAGSVSRDAVPIPHFLALRRNGTVSGWGKNTRGEARGAPPKVKFQAIAAGNSYSIGLDTDGYLHHWGDLGDELLPAVQFTDTSPRLPAPHLYSLGTVPKGRFKSIGAASRHAAAVQDVSPSVLSLLEP